MECGDTPPGEEVNIYSLPGSWAVQTQLEPNQSTTIRLLDEYGNMRVNWNSGTFLSCFVLGAGVGIGVASYTGNPRLGALASSMVAAGCSRAVQYSTEDGDQYIC